MKADAPQVGTPASSVYPDFQLGGLDLFFSWGDFFCRPPAKDNWCKSNLDSHYFMIKSNWVNMIEQAHRIRKYDGYHFSDDTYLSTIEDF